jgi:elongation factor Ts
MMDCKRALEETDGHLEEARTLLREKGIAAAGKRAGRETTAGKVLARGEGGRCTIVAVGCESEPVSDTPEFLAFAKKVLETVDAEGPGAEQRLEDERKELVGKLGENVVVSGAARFEALDGALIDGYAHPPRNKLGVLVQLRGGSKALARRIAMHIAAAKPKALDGSGVSKDLIETERRVAIEKAKEAGKPEAMLEKIAEGSVQKFLKEVALLGQPFVKDDKLTIEALLKSKGAAINGFTLYIVGEGIEKKVTDFAAEVAEQAAAAAKKRGDDGATAVAA